MFEEFLLKLNQTCKELYKKKRLEYITSETSERIVEATESLVFTDFQYKIHLEGQIYDYESVHEYLFFCTIMINGEKKSFHLTGTQEDIDNEIYLNSRFKQYNNDSGMASFTRDIDFYDLFDISKDESREIFYFIYELNLLNLAKDLVAKTEKGKTEQKKKKITELFLTQPISNISFENGKIHFDLKSGEQIEFPVPDLTIKNAVISKSSVS